MSYRDILVQIDERPESAARAAAAAALAGRLDCRLAGVFLRSSFVRNYGAAEMVAYMPPDAIDALLKEQAAAVDKASDAARLIFERAAGDAGVASDWLTVDGDSDAGLVACARRFDLTVFPTKAVASLGQHQIPAGVLGLASGGPLLIVPDQGAGPRCGERVLVAWKGSREGARALRDAWPLIRRAETVHVLVVSPEGEGGPDGLLQRHLEHHDCKADVIVDRSDDASAGEVIRKQAKALNADLIVMGLYGRPRLQELVLGGVSRDLLNDPPCTLLVSH